ncbi:MAG: HAD hydrolase family protein [Bacteroidales bacterium]|nr:HAD hydrolase family protein [Bacteroidales bacterium]MDD3891490.1 HAD hydrolase family protein [Bacteroidales bacterium]
MLRIEISNDFTLLLEHLVLDYNGTLAIDGKLIDGVKEMIETLSANLKVHVITANTFGSAHQNLADTNTSLVIINSGNEAQQKADFVNSLNPQAVVAIGNGANDALMLKLSALGIAVMQAEGVATQALMNADIACNSIIDALGLLLNPLRIAATLRV